jgi:hypothetical protein
MTSVRLRIDHRSAESAHKKTRPAEFLPPAEFDFYLRLINSPLSTINQQPSAFGYQLTAS